MWSKMQWDNPMQRKSQFLFSLYIGLTTIYDAFLGKMYIFVFQLTINLL